MSIQISQTTVPVNLLVEEPEIVIGGIEGGATRSLLLLINSESKEIARVQGPDLNHHLIGINECQLRILQMVNRAKDLAGIPTTMPLHALGLSLSGCEDEASNAELVKGFKQNLPDLCKNYVVGSDTEGAVASVSDHGGVVCISGTGSNTVLIKPRGGKIQCGGWGHLIGDEGSAWDVAVQAITICFHQLDGYEQAPKNIDKVWSVIKDYFKIKNQSSIMKHLYDEFSKHFVAGLTKVLASTLPDDPLCKLLFRQAGQSLARSVAAVIRRAPKEVKAKEINLICVGSMWNSWKLIQEGFVEWLNTHSTTKEILLVKMTVSAAIGAAYMAADKVGVELQKEFGKNYETFYRYTYDETCPCKSSVYK